MKPKEIKPVQKDKNLINSNSDNTDSKIELRDSRKIETHDGVDFFIDSETSKRLKDLAPKEIDKLKISEKEILNSTPYDEAVLQLSEKAKQKMLDRNGGLQK
jgi:hypothetical protein